MHIHHIIFIEMVSAKFNDNIEIQTNFKLKNQNGEVI